MTYVDDAISIAKTISEDLKAKKLPEGTKIRKASISLKYNLPSNQSTIVHG